MDKREQPSVMDADEPTDDAEAFDFPDEEASVAPLDDWLGAVGQMAAALLVVFVLVVLFLGAAVALRRLLP